MSSASIIGVDVGGTNPERPLTTEVIRPGLRVSVVGLRSTPLYHSPEALRVVGPSAFGYQLPFVALQ